MTRSQVIPYSYYNHQINCNFLLLPPHNGQENPFPLSTEGNKLHPDLKIHIKRKSNRIAFYIYYSDSNIRDNR